MTTAIDTTPLSFNVFYSREPSEYPHNLILPETGVPAEDLRRWKYVSIFISLLVFIKPERKQKRKIAIQSHSRFMHLLGSLKKWRRTAYRYIYKKPACYRKH